MYLALPLLKEGVRFKINRRALQREENRKALLFNW